MSVGKSLKVQITRKFHFEKLLLKNLKENSPQQSFSPQLFLNYFKSLIHLIKTKKYLNI